MPSYTRNTEYKESQYATDLVKIMKAGTGPYTRKMLAEALSEKYPDISRQELMNEVSSAIYQDRWTKKNRFVTVKHGWYYLSKK